MTNQDLDHYSEFDVDILASAIAQRLPSHARQVPPVPSQDVDLLASAIAQRLIGSARYTPQVLASAIASRLSGPARVALSKAVPQLRFTDVDAKALLSRVMSRLSGSEVTAETNEKALDGLASAIARRITEAEFSLSPREFDQFASKAASTISRRVAPESRPVGSTLPSDTVDASQALKSEEQRTKKSDKKREDPATSA